MIETCHRSMVEAEKFQQQNTVIGLFLDLCRPCFNLLYIVPIFIRCLQRGQLWMSRCILDIYNKYIYFTLWRLQWDWRTYDIHSRSWGLCFPVLYLLCIVPILSGVSNEMITALTFITSTITLPSEDGNEIDKPMTYNPDVIGLCFPMLLSFVHSSNFIWCLQRDDCSIDTHNKYNYSTLWRWQWDWRTYDIQSRCHRVVTPHAFIFCTQCQFYQMFLKRRLYPRH